MTRPDAPNELAITFLYYRDLPAAMAFYEDVLGLRLTIDQQGLGLDNPGLQDLPHLPRRPCRAGG